MLWRLSGLRAFRVQASDGQCGRVEDFLVDDTNWRVRWVVGDIGSWVAPHKILMPPTAFDPPEENTHVCPTAWTRDRVEHSLDLAADPPVALQMTMRRPMVRDGIDGLAAMAFTAGAHPFLPAVDTGSAPAPESKADPHLRSIAEVTGYDVIARDGVAGAVEDFVLDDTGWSVTHLVVRWSAWWRRHLATLPAAAVEAIDWDTRTLRISMTVREARHGAPLDESGLHECAVPRRAGGGWESIT